MFPDWSGQTAAVVACGQSAAALAPLLAGRCRIIVVNLAFRLLPDADVLYAADSGFWMYYRDAHKFSGVKYGADARCTAHCSSVLRVHVEATDPLVWEPVGHVGRGGGNSAYQALNLAVQLGASRVLLAGVDYTGEHWHGPHPSALRNPSESQFRKWAAAMDAAAPTLHDWGVEVLNLSPVSVLTAYSRIKSNEIQRLFAE